MTAGWGWGLAGRSGADRFRCHDGERHALQGPPRLAAGASQTAGSTTLAGKLPVA